MADFEIKFSLNDALIPLLDAMRGKRELADFLRGAMELGLSELLGDAARRIADRQVSNLQEVQHMDEEPLIWRQLESFLSTAPPSAEPAADADDENLIIIKRRPATI